MITYAAAAAAIKRYERAKTNWGQVHNLTHDATITLISEPRVINSESRKMGYSGKMHDSPEFAIQLSAEEIRRIVAAELEDAVAALQVLGIQP